MRQGRRRTAFMPEAHMQFNVALLICLVMG
jgi:hypothetical protein